MTAWLRNSLPLSKSRPLTANGMAATPAVSAPRMWVWALLRTVVVNTHPVCTQVRLTVRANSPFSVGPQWATVSPSKNPGSASTSSPALRTAIEDRSNGEGLVVDVPRSWSLALAGARYRSIVAALIDSSSARTAGLYLPWGSSRPGFQGEFAMAFQGVELGAHRGCEVLAALPARGRPDPLQHLGRVVGVPRRPGPSRPGRDLPARPWWCLRRRRQPASGVVPRPAGHRDDLVQDPAPLLLRGLHVRLGVPGRDLGTRPHRQPIIHVPGCTPTPPVSRALLGEAPTHFRGHFR